MTETAQWKSTVGIPGYEVSSLGDVRSVDREIVFSRKGSTERRIRKGHLLRPCQGAGGYLEVRLSVSGSVHHRLVHRLVAEAFLPTPPCGVEVNHVDGEKSNNAAGNLEWVSRSGNHLHRARTLRKCSAEDHYNAKLSFEDVERIRQLNADGEPQASIAKRFGVSPQQIWRIIHRKSWHIEAIKKE
ncbi:HNH endonuclease [Pseudomonas aeruginosa]